ncbi:MAG: hypothetical protein EA362_13045 [Saprospirales bacterium]|nr:MAG: hypothetical protein EA362_13045 [Saprospirales bacterium]
MKVLIHLTLFRKPYPKKVQKYSIQKLFIEKSSKNFYRTKKIVNYAKYEFICTFKMRTET